MQWLRSAVCVHKRIQTTLPAVGDNCLKTHSERSALLSDASVHVVIRHKMNVGGPVLIVDCKRTTARLEIHSRRHAKYFFVDRKCQAEVFNVALVVFHKK